MGLDAGYSSAAQRRVAIWNAMNPQAAAQVKTAPAFATALDDTGKPVELKPVETKPVETKPAETKPVETKTEVKTETPAASSGGAAAGTQLSSSTLAELLTLTSEISKRQDVAYSSLVDKFKEGKSETQGLAGKLDTLAAQVKTNNTDTATKLDDLNTTLSEQFDKVKADLATLTARIEALTTTTTTP